jgi:hypothetical protein
MTTEPRPAVPNNRSHDNRESEHVAFSISWKRALVAGGICVLASAYTFGIVIGLIPTERRIDGSTLVVLAFAGLLSTLLVNPNAFERLRRLKLAGFELEVEKLKQIQDQQQSQLDAISLLLPLLLNSGETTLLLDLSNDDATHLGSKELRTELRHLAAVELIERLPGRKVGEVKDGASVHLFNYVRLTSFGRRMVAQLTILKKRAADEE